MGEIRIPVKGQDTNHWPEYMGQKLEAVIRDWVFRVEHGKVGVWAEDGSPISVEHLRIAKLFLTSSERR